MFKTNKCQYFLYNTLTFNKIINVKFKFRFLIIIKLIENILLSYKIVY